MKAHQLQEIHRFHVAMVAIALLSAVACHDSVEPIGPPVTGIASVAAAGGVGAPIPGQYIIRLRDDVSDPGTVANQLVSASGGTLGFVYRYAIKGFSANLSAAA